MSQVSALINMMFNRDPQCHTHVNFQGNGLPKALANEIFKELFAADGVSGDPLYLGYRTAAKIDPMNKSKAVFAKLSLIYLELHNSLTICNYTLPGWASPLKSRNYRGDADMDAKYLFGGHGRNRHPEAVGGYGNPDSLPRAGAQRPLHEYEGPAEAARYHSGVGVP